MKPIKTPAVISYSAEVAKSVNFNIGEFKRILDYVLQHQNGWKQYGYSFLQLCSKANAKSIRCKKHLHIILCNPEDVKKACGTSRLSCYDPSSNKIYINYKNWNGGSQSDLSVDDYRIYVINHEVGHGLGFEHTKCPATVDLGKYCELASIMQQMSKGPEHIKPCKSNMWPLAYPAEFELQETATTGLFMGGGILSICESEVFGGKNSFSSQIIFVLIITIVLIAVYICVSRDEFQQRQKLAMQKIII